MTGRDVAAATEARRAPQNTSIHIVGVRPVLLSWPYPPGRGPHWVGGSIESWTAALVEVTLEDGTTGIGEAGAGIMAASALPGIVEAFEPYIVGQTFTHPRHVGDRLRDYSAFWARGGIASGVLGAIELACIDAAGKREGVPAWALLGGENRRLEVYASGGLGSTFDEVLTWCEEQVEAGFRTVKFRAMKDPDTTIDLVRFIAPRLPDGVRFILDAVQACAARPWSIDDALRVGREAAEWGARWFEEPCHAEDIDGFVQVRRELDVPISGVESSTMVREFATLIERHAVDVVQPDATFIGGATAFQTVAQLAADAGIDCVPHVWGSGVTLAANLHTSIAAGTVNLFEFCTLTNPMREGLLTDPLDLTPDGIAPGASPGFGVRVDAEAEERFRYERGGGHVIR